MSTRLAFVAAAALLALVAQPALAAPISADRAETGSPLLIPVQSYSAQGPAGAKVSGTRNAPGNVTRKSQGALGGTATVNRQVGPNGATRTVNRTGPLGGQYNCTTGVQRGAGTRASGTSCTGPAGNTVSGGSNLQRNPDGSVSGTVTGPMGRTGAITATPVPAQ